MGGLERVRQRLDVSRGWQLALVVGWVGLAGFCVWSFLGGDDSVPLAVAVAGGVGGLVVLFDAGVTIGVRTLSRRVP